MHPSSSSLAIVDPIEAHSMLHSQNMWHLSMHQRVLFMNATLQQRFVEAESVYDEAMRAHKQALATLRHHELTQQVSVLQSHEVVGLTISGAAIYADLIEQLKPTTVLVEEAGEVLEPLLVAGLGPWVERLILIGDHLQLRPSVETHALEKDYLFNTSLMERLVNNDMPHATLSSQARMMPEFATLLEDVYPKLQTSARVLAEARVSPPPGLAHNLWWWDVKGVERDDLRSWSNSSEEIAVAALVVHLVRSGVAPARITVIASYKGQASAFASKALHFSKA